MKTCSKCNSQFDDGKKFCTKCGSPLGSVQKIDTDRAVSKEQTNVPQLMADDIKKGEKPSNRIAITGILVTLILLVSVAAIILDKQINNKKTSLSSKTTVAPSAKTATPSSRNTIIDEITGMEFLFVKGGCYPMGDTFGDGNSEEKPVHEVCVSDFYMGKYEVTQGQWKKLMRNNPSMFKKSGDNRPVENVTWDDAQAFISKLRSQSGKKYRLPTEAEWEYAARSGGKKEKWAGTSNELSLGNYAWYGNNSKDTPYEDEGVSVVGQTRPVGMKKPNGLGIYDMSGNVWEWCQDLYNADYYRDSPRNNPLGPSVGSTHVVRGGGWFYASKSLRVSTRVDAVRGAKRDLGFRLAQDK